MSRQLAALKARHPDKVSDAYVDSDGAWIELNPGWTANPRDAHDIVESTVSAVLARFRDVEPCTCAECSQCEECVRSNGPHYTGPCNH